VPRHIAAHGDVAMQATMAGCQPVNDAISTTAVDALKTRDS
jgi:hypothetical protein